MTGRGQADLLTRVVNAFAWRIGGVPGFVARAPGRVNLIGEHTDYNDGFVLPMAINRAVWIAARARADRRVVVHSLDFEESAVLDLAAITHADDGWPEYLRGVAWALGEAGHRLECGWEGVMAGDVPVGAGLSSSAALELAAARAFAEACGLPWDPAAMARSAQRAENEWVGVRSGIMDQMISASGLQGHCLLIDCRSLATRAVPLPPGVAVVVMDTATRRGLVDSAYNERRAQCEAAARALGVPALRDATLAMLDAHAAALDATTRRRARHVVTENARTLDAADALARGDAPAVGALMDASHASLRDDFEVSRAELDAIVAIAREQPGCHGARMTGAGFGGCAVALVDERAAGALVAEVAHRYQRETGLRPALYVCAAAAGASVERLDGRD